MARLVRVGDGDLAVDFEEGSGLVYVARNPEDSVLKGLLLCNDNADQVFRRDRDLTARDKRLKRLGVARHGSPKRLLDLILKSHR